MTFVTAVLRPEVLAYLRHADVLDTNLFGQEGDLGLMPIILGGDLPPAASGPACQQTLKIILSKHLNGLL